MSVAKVSVLVPTYNYARYLPEALDSILAQDYSDFEILVSDDCSTDGSADIIREYAARNTRIRFELQRSNLGMVANWNWCLHEARGDYLKFLFGDDRLACPTALSTLAALLDQNPGAIIAASAREIVDERSLPLAIWDELGNATLHSGSELIARCLRNNRNLIGEPSAVMFRRSAAMRGFDPTYRQIVDLEMWLHLLQSGELVYTRKALCSFRVHPAQQTAVNRRDSIGSRESLRLLGRYLDYLDRDNKRPGLPSTERTLFRILYYSRKDNPRTPDILASENSLRARLSSAAYAIQWVRHRLVKPFENVWRKLQKLTGNPTPVPGIRPISRPTVKLHPHPPGT